MSDTRDHHAASREVRAYLEAIGFREPFFSDHTARLEEQFGFRPAQRDIAWRWLNAAVSAQGRGPLSKAKLHTLAGLYRAMARLQHADGKDAAGLVAQAAQTEQHAKLFPS